MYIRIYTVKSRTSDTCGRIAANPNTATYLQFPSQGPLILIEVLMATTSAGVDDPTVRIKRHAYGHPISTRTLQNYVTAALFVTDDEMNSAILGGISWDDLKRQNMAASYIQQVIALLIYTSEHCGTATNLNPQIHTYFIRIKGVGFVFLISIDTLQTMFSWSDLITQTLCQTKQKRGKTGASNAPAYTELASPLSLVYAINACMHPLSTIAHGASIALQPHLHYIHELATLFADRATASHNRCVGQQNRAGRNRRRGAGHDDEEEEPPGSPDAPEAPGAPRLIDHAVIQEITEETPGALINIFLALAVPRIFTAATLAYWGDELLFLASDAQNSIFSSDGSIRFDRLPAHASAFEINISCMSESWFFPDHLPCTPSLKDALIRSNPSFGDLLATMPEQMIRDHVLHERMHQLQFFNPTKYGTFIERVPVGMGNMPYMTTFAENISAAASTMPSDHLDEYMAEQLERIINIMAVDFDTTPDAPRCFAKTIRESLGEVGMHFIQPDDRHTDNFAWLSFVLTEFHAIGGGAHIITIMLNTSMAYMTGLFSRHGGIHLHSDGCASDGKSFAMLFIMPNVFPAMIRCQSISPQGIFSHAAQLQFPHNLVFMDEFSAQSFGGQYISYADMKNMLAGANTMLTRVRDTTFSQSKDTGAKSAIRTFPCPSPITFVATGNVVLTKCIVTHERDTVGTTSAGASRILSQGLPPLNEAVKRNILHRTISAVSKSAIFARSAHVRIFFAHCSFVALLVSKHVFQIPYNVDHIYYAERLAAAFADVCPAYPIKDQRLQSHLISTPFVAVIMDAVYNMIMCGGPHKRSPTLREYCRVVVAISKRLVPSVKHVVFGTSMLLSIFNKSSDTDTFATQLLQHINADYYNSGEHMFQLTPRIINTMAPAIGIPVATLTSELKNLSTREVDNPTRNPALAYATRADQRTPGGWLVNPAFIRRGLDARSPVDIAIVEHVTLGYLDAADQPPAYEVPFLQLMKAIGDAADVPGSSIPNTEHFYIDAIKKRVFLGFFIPRDTADQSNNWINTLGSGSLVQFTNPLFRQMWANRSIVVTHQYVDTFKSSSMDTSRVARVVRSVVKQPGEYVLCCPSTAAVNIPTVVTIEASDPPTQHDHNPVFFDPLLLSASHTDPMFSDWRSTVFAFGQQAHSPYEFCMLQHLIKNYACTDIGRMSIHKQKELVAAMSLDHINTKNTPRGAPPRPFASFKLVCIDDMQPVNDPRASRTYLSLLSDHRRLRDDAHAMHDSSQADSSDVPHPRRRRAASEHDRQTQSAHRQKHGRHDHDTMQDDDDLPSDMNSNSP